MTPDPHFVRIKLARPPRRLSDATIMVNISAVWAAVAILAPDPPSWGLYAVSAGNALFAVYAAWRERMD